MAEQIEAGRACARLAARLAGAGLEAPRLEAELLTALVLGEARLFVRMHPERILTSEEAARLEALASRREDGEPLAYITGSREFYGRDFIVRRGVLVPRPETELVVDTALELCPGHAPLRFADICAGSGCIGITLQLERPVWKGLMIELMPVPAETARDNAALLGAPIPVVRADLFAAPLPPDSVDLIVSNPPYIAPQEREQMDPEVIAHEPAEALFSGEDGLDAVRGLAKLAAQALGPGGLLVMEHGWHQGSAVRSILAAENFLEIFTKKDLAGLDRVTLARI